MYVSQKKNPFWCTLKIYHKNVQKLENRLPKRPFRINYDDYLINVVMFTIKKKKLHFYF